MKSPFHGKKKQEPAYDLLERAVNQHTHDYVTIRELLYTLHERGFALLMLVLVLPNCVPIPVPPGVSTVFSLPLLFLATQMLMGRTAPWLPDWVGNRKMNRLFLVKMVSAASPRLKKVEILLRPRLAFASSATGERVIAGFWLLFAISIAIPLPMTNFIPGVGIAVSALGVLSKDGVVILLGLAIGMVGLIVTSLVLFLGAEAAQATLDYAAQAIGHLAD